MPHTRAACSVVAATAGRHRRRHPVSLPARCVASGHSEARGHRRRVPSIRNQAPGRRSSGGETPRNDRRGWKSGRSASGKLIKNSDIHLVAWYGPRAEWRIWSGHYRMKRFILDGFGVLAFQRGLLAPGGDRRATRRQSIAARHTARRRPRRWRALAPCGPAEALHTRSSGRGRVPGDRTDARPHKFALTSTPTCRRGPVAGGRATSTRTPAAKAAWTLACGS